MNAWHQEGDDRSKLDITAYIDFDHSADRITSWICPKGSQPAKRGPEAAKCRNTGEYLGYFANTRNNIYPGGANNNPLHFVSDLWNNDGPRNCGPQPGEKNAVCSWTVRDLKVKFTKNKNMFLRPDRCKHIWAD